MSRETRKIIVAMILVLLLAAVSIPGLVRPHIKYATNACANSLRRLNQAKQFWQRERKTNTNAVPTWDELYECLDRISPGVPVRPRCPNGGNYSIGGPNDPLTCSIGGEGHTLPKD